MITRKSVLVTTSVLAVFALMAPVRVHAQDVPGIEICTVEKTMERRTSCLQSNVNFLQATLGKQGRDYQMKLDAATRQIDGLNAALVSLQKSVEDLQAAQKKATPVAKDAPAPAVKDGAK